MSTEQPYEPYVGAQPQQTSDRGSSKCLIWGCLFALLLVIVLIVLVLGGTYWVYQGQVKRFTDEKPIEIPVVEVSEEELEEVKKRIFTFKQTVEPRVDDGSVTDEKTTTGNTEQIPEGNALDQDDIDESASTDTPPAPTELRLTAREINALIAAEPDLRGRVYVDIKDGRITGKVSFPTDFLPAADGRYFNADADFDVFMRNGILIVQMVDARVNGEQIPETVRQALASENLAKEFSQDPQQAEILRQFESIEVVDDMIVLKLRSNQVEEKTDETTETADAPAEDLSKKSQSENLDQANQTLEPSTESPIEASNLLESTR